MDYFKFAEAYPLLSMDAETVVAQTLVNEFIMRYGVPLQLHSDRGTNVMSDLFKMCQLLGVENTQTTSFYPQSDGLVERFNKTLETMLSMFVASNQKDWDQWLPALTCAYHATPQNSTMQSPNLMMFGRELSLPNDLMIGPPSDGGQIDVSDYISQLREKLEVAHQIAREKFNYSAQRQKKYYDNKVNEEPYSEGNFVWVHGIKRKKGLSPKLQRPWEGP